MPPFVTLILLIFFFLHLHRDVCRHAGGSLTAALYSPSLLIGSSSTIFRLSTSMPCSRSALAISMEVTEPKSLSSSPAAWKSVTVACSSFSARDCVEEGEWS